MDKKHITIKELAQLVGVSTSTISKALNNSYEISEETKVKVRAFAERYNYRPNTIARNLKLGKTKTIAVVLPSIQNHFFAQVLYGIESVIAKTSYNIIISITNESLQKEANSLITLSNGIVDGFIFTASEDTQINQDFNHLQQALDRNKPIVMFDRIIQSIESDKVKLNEYESVFNATKYLLDRGRNTIALVSTINNLSVGKLRTQGYIKAVENSLNEVAANVIVEATIDTVETAIEDLLNNNRNIDGIIALDEESSLAALKVAKLNNLKIPEQLSIIGYASEKMALNVSPKLTAINQHGIKIGEATAKMLLDRLNSPARVIETITMTSTLNHRETS